jgi:hypothetical protein
MRVLLGPILFVMDVAPANVWSGIALTILLIPAMALVAFRPRVWTAAVSIAALTAWLILGIVGDGIEV